MKNPDEEDRNARYLAWTFNYRKVKVSKRYQILPDLDIVLTLKHLSCRCHAMLKLRLNKFLFWLFFNYLHPSIAKFWELSGVIFNDSAVENWGGYPSSSRFTYNPLNDRLTDFFYRFPYDNKTACHPTAAWSDSQNLTPKPSFLYGRSSLLHSRWIPYHSHSRHLPLSRAPGERYKWDEFGWFFR